MFFHISELFSSTQKFVRKIRRSEEETKKKWFFGGISLSMIFVLALWIMSLNISIEPAFPEDEVQKYVPPEVVEEESSHSIMGIFERGAAYIWEDVSNFYDSVSDSIETGITSLQNRLEGDNEIYIEGERLNFTPRSLEIVPPTQLP